MSFTSYWLGSSSSNLGINTTMADGVSIKLLCEAAQHDLPRGWGSLSAERLGFVVVADRHNGKTVWKYARAEALAAKAIGRTLAKLVEAYMEGAS